MAFLRLLVLHLVLTLAAGERSNCSVRRSMERGPSLIQRHTGSNLRLSLQNNETDSCSQHNQDPYFIGFPCCAGLQACLGFWGRWHFRCLDVCPGSSPRTTTTTTTARSCTPAGSDPWESGTEVLCCDHLQSCLGDWKGYWHYYCLASCSSNPAPTTTTDTSTSTTSEPTTTSTPTSTSTTTTTTTAATSSTSSATTATATPSTSTSAATTSAITDPSWTTTTTTRCATKGRKPISTGQCCAGLRSCLGDWHATGRWSFQCLESCSTSSCTVKDEDPSATGQTVPCCSGLSSCKRVIGGQDQFVCLESCKDAATTTTTTTTARYSASKLCGIAANHGTCAEELEYLRSLDENLAASMRCMGYGGNDDPCHLSITNDKNVGMEKDPSKCHQDVFFLWDEPDTQCERGHASCGQNWASARWKNYAEKWRDELKIARARGMVITTPLMKSGNEQALLNQYSSFFEGCPECLDTESPYYVGALAWNAFCTQKPPSQYEVADQFSYLKTLAAAVKNVYPSHTLLATNFGLLSAHKAADQAAAIADYGIFDAEASQIDGVFYFAAQDYCGQQPWECTSNNFLSSIVESGPHEGKSLGHVLLDTCFR